MRKSGTSQERTTDLGRRRFLRAVSATAGCAALAGGLLAPGCSRGEPQSGEVGARFPVDDLQPGERKVVRFLDQPVEITRTADGVRARSLICSHMSCTVRWDAARERYLCPCHKGEFDRHGRVVAGPPVLPLTEFPAILEAGDAILGG